MPKLKPCPRCGVVPQIYSVVPIDGRYEYAVACCNVNCDNRFFPTRQYAEVAEAVEAWNRRVNSGKG